MISESALERACRPAILGRARMISRREGRIWQRACTYEGSLTHLTARVDSASGYAESYEASITFDEVADEVFSYDCTCPAARRYSGPCKHSIALALDFTRHAELYEGFSSAEHMATSAAIVAYLERTQREAPPRIPMTDAEAVGAVRVEPRILRDGDLFLGIRVVGTRGGYVVRDLGEFEARMSEGAYASYGRKLAFTHDLAAFVERDRALVHFVCRCVQNRRSYAGTRLYGRLYATSGMQASMGKELRLSPPETDELLELLQGYTVSFEQTTQAGRRAIKCDVTVVDADPQVGMALVPAEGGAYRLERTSVLDVFSTGEHTYALQGDHLYRCSERLGRAASFLQQVYCSQASDLVIAEEDLPRFMVQVLPEVERALPVACDASLDALRPAPLKMTFRLDVEGNLITCDATVRYGDKSANLATRAQGEDTLWRDVRAEADARAVVGRYFSVVRESGAYVSRPDVDSVARIVYEGVAELARLGTVEQSEAFQHLARKPRPRVQVRVSARQGAGLIDLTLHADDLPASELQTLLASYRQRERYHRLSDGTVVDLGQADLAEAARLADELGLTAQELATGAAQVPSYKAFLIDALVPDDEKDASFRAELDSFRQVDIDVYEPPAPLAERLRPYQVEGFRWLSALVDMGFGGILADEMGLGKSVQVISLLLARQGQGRTLIVCPASLVYNWVAEFEKFAPGLDVAAVAGAADERRRVRREEGRDVLVTSYDLLRRDVEDYACERFWCVVLDEAQYVKNHQTLAARAVKALTAQHRLALTGTPVENRLSELWSIFDFLMPGLLGGYERFRERYEQPVADGDDETMETLRRAVAPFILRRLKAEVLDDLPEKLEQVVTCRMGRTQRGLYAAREQALRESLMQTGGGSLGRERMAVLAELTRLRQLCCDPRLVYEDYDGGSCKLDTIWQLVLRAMDAHAKVLVFSQFTSFLSLIADRLDEQEVRYYTITGATPKARRVELVDAFNGDDTPVFLVSLRAGGTGLNLVGASVVIHADPWWNMAVQDQATDRAHRIGQTRDVTVYKVVCGRTIEERIVALQEAKSMLAEQVVDGDAGVPSLSALSRDDLLALLEEDAG